MVDRLLSERIWAKILAGELPAERPENTWGGPSEGAQCSACDQAIDKGASEIEVDSVDGGRRYYHRGCYVVLDAIRGRIPRRDEGTIR